MSPSSNKKILFIAPSAYPLGGVQTWLDYLLPSLRQYNYQTVIGLPSDCANDAKKYLAVHPMEHAEVIEGSTATTEGRIAAIENLVQKVDPIIVVVVNVYDVYQAVNNLRRDGRTTAKIVATLHGIQADLLSGIRTNIDIIDAVISTNRLTQKLVELHTGIASEQSFYAPYGVPSITPKPKKEEPKFRVAYVGRIEEHQKRIDDLLTIFSRLLVELDNIEILIAGSGEDMPKLKSWLKEESRHASKIKYLGVLDSSLVASEVYAKCDVLLLTSSWETGPIVAWEAMSHGVTVVSSRYVGYLEEGSLINQQNCLLFDIGDINGAVDQILNAQNFQLHTAINRNALTLVETKYSIKKSVDWWANCFGAISKLPTKPYSSRTPYVQDHSRLTRLAKSIFGFKGIRYAEKFRQLFIRKKMTSAWPHSYCRDEIKLINLDEYLYKRDQ